MSRCRLHAKILYLIIDDRFFVCQFLPMCGLRDCRFSVVVATQLRADDVATAASRDVGATPLPDRLWTVALRTQFACRAGCDPEERSGSGRRVRTTA